MLLEDIGSYLQANSIGTLASDLFLGIMPSDPANCVTLYEYAGKPRVRKFGNTDILEAPGLQIKVRNVSYALCRQKLEQIIVLMDGMNNVVLGSTKYLSIEANQGATPLGVDGNNRMVFTVNFSVLKEVG